MRTRRAIAWGLAVAAAAPSVAAQQEPQAQRVRRQLVGTVVDGDGRTLPGASVTVVHVSDGEASLPARHHATATTDSRGRFRVEVLAGVDHRVFAIGPPDERGTCFVSEVCETTGNTLLTLSATERMPVRTFRLEHAERWREFAPLRLRVLPAGAELTGFEQALGDDGRVVLPPLPSGYSTFEVLTGTGVLATMTLRSDGDVVMPTTPVWDVPIELVDEAGQPVVGAVVQQRLASWGWTAPGRLQKQSMRQTHRSLGTSDASGRLVARVPRADDPFGDHPGDGLLLGATAVERRATAAGACGHLFEGTAVRPAGDTSRGLRLVMPRATPRQVRLHWGGRPQSGLRLLATGTVTIRSGASSHTLPWIDSATTDEHGLATFASLPDDVATARLALADLPGVLDGLFPAQLPAPRVLLPTLETRDRAILDVDLATFRRLHVRVLDPHHAPAQTARVVLAQSDQTATTSPIEFPVDQNGQWTAVVPTGPWCALAMDGDGCTFTTLAVGGPTPQVMQLLPLRIVEGRVVDARGNGVGNAVSSPVEFRFDGQFAADPTLQALITRILQHEPVTTRADGTFQLRMANLPGCVPWLRFRVVWASSPSFAADGSEPIELVIPNR